MATELKMNPDRALCFEILTRMRESQQAARRFPDGTPRQSYELGRARAFDECFTELKGLGLADK